MVSIQNNDARRDIFHVPLNITRIHQHTRNAQAKSTEKKKKENYSINESSEFMLGAHHSLHQQHMRSFPLYSSLGNPAMANHTCFGQRSMPITVLYACPRT